MQVMKNNKIKVLFVLMLLVMLSGGGFLFSVKATDMVLKNENIKTVKVETAKVGNFQAFNEYGGFVRGEKQASLAPKISGRLVSVLKNEGDRVKKGETIAILNADEIVAQSQTAKQTIDALYENLNKTEKYYKQKVDEAKEGEANKEEIKSAKRLRDLQAQEVETEITRAKGGLNEIQSLVKEAIIRAPFDGVITRVSGEAGQLVGPSVAVCEVADDSQLVVEVFVSRDVLMQLNKNQKIKALCGDEQKECQGEIIVLGVIGENNGQKALVKVAFEKSDPKIYLGQYVSLQLSDDIKNNQLVISEKSIIAKYDEKFVFVEKDGSVKEKKVSLGKMANGKVEILSGIFEDEKVVIEGVNKLRDGDSVEIYE